MVVTVVGYLDIFAHVGIPCRHPFFSMMTHGVTDAIRVGIWHEAVSEWGEGGSVGVHAVVLFVVAFTGLSYLP